MTMGVGLFGTFTAYLHCGLWGRGMAWGEMKEGGDYYFEVIVFCFVSSGLTYFYCIYHSFYIIFDYMWQPRIRKIGGGSAAD